MKGEALLQPNDALKICHELVVMAGVGRPDHPQLYLDVQRAAFVALHSPTFLELIFVEHIQRANREIAESAAAEISRLEAALAHAKRLYVEACESGSGHARIRELETMCVSHVLRWTKFAAAVEHTDEQLQIAATSMAAIGEAEIAELLRAAAAKMLDAVRRSS